MPSPDFVKPPVVGAIAPPIGTSTVSVVPAPKTWTSTSRLPATFSMPAPPMVFEAVARMPPESSERLAFALMVMPVAAALKVSELTPVVWKLAGVALTRVAAATRRMFSSVALFATTPAGSVVRKLPAAIGWRPAAAV